MKVPVQAPPGFVWMHAPRDLTPQLVAESQVTYLQATRWMHAEAPLEEIPDPPAAELVGDGADPKRKAARRGGSK